jgi:hypothetical protein
LKKNVFHFIFAGLIFYSTCLISQSKQDIGIIKVKKEKQFVKAAFDDTEFKVIAFDKYGNPHEQAIKSFIIFYKEGKSVYESAVEGNTFPQKTIDFFTKKKKFATKLCLIKVIAADKNGHEELLPDLCDIVVFPDCKKLNKKKGS